MMVDLLPLCVKDPGGISPYLLLCVGLVVVIAVICSLTWRVSIWSLSLR